MSRPAWMDKLHEFRENVNDGSMCLCGIPALYHNDWEDRMLREEKCSQCGECLILADTPYCSCCAAPLSLT